MKLIKDSLFDRFKIWLGCKLLKDHREIHDKYYELIMHVSRKFKGESRHETALRYIKESENIKVGSVGSSDSPIKRLSSELDKWGNIQ